MDPEEYHEAAATSKLLGEELVRRGRYMDQLGQRLISNARTLMKILDQPQTLTIKGNSSVTLRKALECAKELGTFSDEEFSAALGIELAAGKRWIELLRRGTEVEKAEGKGMFSAIIKQ